MENKKKLVVVTGATGTLGMAVCRELINDGYYPVAVARSKDDLVRLAAEYPGKIHTYACDVGNSDQIAGLFDEAPFTQNATLSGVVTCAGILKMGDTASFDIELWDSILRTNISGTYYTFRNAIPRMRNNGGVLIAIGSRWADGAKNAVAYSASKAALRGMIRAMQKEFAGTAIRPVLVSPGSIASNMSDSVNADTSVLDILHAEDIAATILHILRSPQRAIFEEVTVKAYNYDLTDEYAT